MHVSFRHSTLRARSLRIVLVMIETFTKLVDRDVEARLDMGMEHSPDQRDRIPMDKMAHSPNLGSIVEYQVDDHNMFLSFLLVFKGSLEGFMVDFCPSMKMKFIEVLLTIVCVDAENQMFWYSCLTAT